MSVPALWKIGPDVTIDLSTFRLMAIINVTPDSFSDGGSYFDRQSAVARAQETIAEGAEILDIGGESTRPGAQRIAAAEQIRRVVPVIEAIRVAGVQAPISIDTTRAEVARAAIQAGARIINDVSAGDEDPQMLPLAAETRCGIILMHRRVPPDADSYSHRYERAPDYSGDGGVVASVCDWLDRRIARARSAGIDPQSIVLDPGLGFGKSVEQNYELIASSGRLCALGYPVLSAASRKSFIGSVIAQQSASDRVAGSIAVSVAHYLAGLRLFRVHDVAAHRQALMVAGTIAAQAVAGSRTSGYRMSSDETGSSRHLETSPDRSASQVQ